MSQTPNQSLQRTACHKWVHMLGRRHRRPLSYIVRRINGARRMRLFVLMPDYNAEGNLPWHWLEDTRPWSSERDQTLFRVGKKSKTWRPIPVRIVRRLDREDPCFCRMKRPDVYDFRTGYPVVNHRAWSVLEPVIGPYTEALPLQTVAGDQLLLVNVLDRVPLAKDADVSWNPVIKWFTSVRRYSFREKDVGSKVIFRVEGMALGHCLVTAAVRNAVVRAKLRGVCFPEVKDWHAKARTVYKQRHRRTKRST